MGQPTKPEFAALNYGNISPKLRGRADLDFYDQALDYLLNYKVTAQGELQFREGSVYVANTRNNNIARLMPFIYGTDDAYILEVSDDFMRFYRNHGLITLTPQNITGITNANPAVVTYAGSDTYANGDRIYLSGVAGMHQVNGREFIVANVNTVANTFELQDVTAANINSTAYGVYTSGGAVSEVYEIASPYQEADLFDIDYTQTENTMYIVHASHQVRKLTRSAHTNWTLATFDFVSNPFGTTLGTGQSITGITKANPAVVTYSGADTYTNGMTIKITGVVGMTEVNNKIFTVRNVNVGANTFELEAYDSTANTAYTSGGLVEHFTDFSWPSIVTQFDGRIIYGASDTFQTRLWFSSIQISGSLDNFITGTNDNDAIIYNVRGDQANRLRWIAGAENYIALGTSGGEFRISGGGENNAITPTNISIKPTSFNGVKKIKPIRLDSYILYVQRNGQTVRSFEYNALQDGYTSPDRTLLADHIGSSKFKQFSYTSGTPNIIWGVKNDGKMAGLTFDPAQKVVAWHPHSTPGQYESVATIPETLEDDELWTVVTRTINGQTVRFVEYTPNVPEIPVKEDYFTDEDNEETDEADYLTALWNVQKTLIHCDASLSYDGRSLTTGINLTITGTLTSGSTVTVDSSAAFFTSAMATDQRRLQTPDGGQIQIETFNTNQQVIGTVLYDLEAASFTGGEWYYMARALSGLWHIEGETAALLADGGNVENKVVTNGELELDDDAGYVIAGLKYIGIGKTEDVSTFDQRGRGQTNPKAMTNLGVRFRASIGTKFGTSLYTMEHPNYRMTGEVAGRPPRLIDGVMKIDIEDGFDDEAKHLYWLHDSPTPSNIQYLQPLIEGDDR